MAFTIDFGNDESEEKKKLSLRDGIRRFAPNKKTPREKASSADSVTSTSPSPVAVVVVRLPTNSNNFVDRKVEPSTSFDEFRQALCLPTQAVLEGVGRHSNRRIFTAEIWHFKTLKNAFNEWKTILICLLAIWFALGWSVKSFCILIFTLKWELVCLRPLTSKRKQKTTYGNLDCCEASYRNGAQDD